MENKQKAISSFRVITLFILFSIMGAFLVWTLPIELYSEVPLKQIKVSFAWPNAPSMHIANHANAVMEGAFNRLKGIKSINSVSSFGQGEILLEFDNKTDIDIARYEVTMAIRQIVKNLPEDISYPHAVIINANSDQQKPVLSFSISGKGIQSQELSNFFTDIIRPALMSIDGIKEIKTTGLHETDYLLRFNANKFEYYNIDLSEIKKAIENNFETVDIGKFTESIKGQSISRNILIKNAHSYIGNIPIKSDNGRLIRLSDICSVEPFNNNPIDLYRVNGKNSVNITLYSKNSINQIKLCHTIKNRLDLLQKKSSLPLNYRINFDSSEHLEKELTNIKKRMALSILCILAIFLIIYHKVYIFIVLLLALIQNILISVILYKVLDVNINLYSLAALTVSYGIIIDNIVIMIDELKNNGRRSVITSIIASTLTTISALLVILFVAVEEQVLFKDFSLILIINLSVSIIVAYYFIPAIFMFPGNKWRIRKFGFKVSNIKTFKKTRYVHKYNCYYARLLKLMLKFRPLFVVLIILSFGIPVYDLPINMNRRGPFPEIYNKVFGSDYYVENIRPLVNTVFGGSLRLFSQYVIKNPEYDNQDLAIKIEASMDKGATFEQINKPLEQIEGYLLMFKGIDHFNTTINSPNSAQIIVFFKEKYLNTSFPEFLQGLVIDKSIQIEGVSWNISGIGDSFDNSKDKVAGNYRLYMYGYNYNLLEIYADKLKQDLLKNERIPEVNIISSGSPIIEENNSYLFSVDNRKVYQYNIQWKNIVRNIKYESINREFVTSVLINGQKKDIYACPENLPNNNFWKLNNVNHSNLSLKDIGDFMKNKSSKDVYREKQQYRLILDYNYIGTEKFGDRWLNTVMDNNNQKLPFGYTIKKDDIFGSNNKAKINKGLILLLTVIIIYVTCSILFNSIVQPLIILSILPFSFIGVFLTFYLFDLDFDHGGFASFIILAGITINSNIYIINKVNLFCSESKKINTKKIFLKAFNRMILPILITIISTSIGLAPFLFGNRNQYFWFSMSAGTIGGLIFSLLGIIFYLPLFIIKKKDL